MSQTMKGLVGGGWGKSVLLTLQRFAFLWGAAILSLWIQIVYTRGRNILCFSLLLGMKFIHIFIRPVIVLLIPR